MTTKGVVITIFGLAFTAWWIELSIKDGMTNGELAVSAGLVCVTGLIVYLADIKKKV